MSKRKKHLLSNKKERKWLMPVIIAGLVILGVGLSVVISMLLRGEKMPIFDEQNAYKMATEQFYFKNRYPGTPEHEQAKSFLVSTLSEYTDYVSEQSFTFTDEIKNEQIELTNIIASFYPDNQFRIMLCAHYDTPKNDDLQEDTTTGKILGSTDNCSGIAILLEIARLLHQQEPNKGVDIILFDGTSYGIQNKHENLFMGAKYFVEQKPEYSPNYTVNINSVGYPDLEIYADRFSDKYAGEIKDMIWAVASENKVTSFKEGKKPTVADNHLILVKNEYKCVNLFDVDGWKLEDSPRDNMSQQSLQDVGKVLIQLIYQ